MNSEYLHIYLNLKFKVRVCQEALSYVEQQTSSDGWTEVRSWAASVGACAAHVLLIHEQRTIPTHRIILGYFQATRIELQTYRKYSIPY